MELYIKWIKKPKNASLVSKTCLKSNLYISATIAGKGLVKSVCTKPGNSASSEAKSAKPATINS